MKQKTLNAQRRVDGVQRIPDCRVCEDAPVYTVREKTNSTSNPQRSTPHAQRAGKLRFDLENRLLEFSVRIVRLVDSLPNTRAANHLAGQLLGCGTSPYGNHGEVEAAESRRDFVHKLKVCLKKQGNSSMVTPDCEIVDGPSTENECDPQRDERTHQNFLLERPNGRKKCEMTARVPALGAGR